MNVDTEEKEMPEEMFLNIKIYILIIYLLFLVLFAFIIIYEIMTILS